MLGSLPADLFADQGAPSAASTWDSGVVRHLLPTVSDTHVLVKASSPRPLMGAPSLRIGSTTVRGRMNDTKGEFWQFHADGLQAGRRYSLSLLDASGGTRRR